MANNANTAPATNEAVKPCRLTPPSLPALTFRKFVIKYVLELKRRLPSSVAHVSAIAVARAPRAPIIKMEWLHIAAKAKNVTNQKPFAQTCSPSLRTGLSGEVSETACFLEISALVTKKKTNTAAPGSPPSPKT